MNHLYSGNQHTNICMCTYTHNFIHTVACAHTHVHKCMHTHTKMHDKHAHTHTYAHTHTHKCMTRTHAQAPEQVTWYILSKSMEGCVVFEQS